MSGSLQRGVAAAATLVLLAALGWTILRPAGQYRVTAWFTQTVGLYPGSDVRILGIPVGEVTDILSRNRAALGQTINNLAPFVRVFTNTLGNGRWFDSFVDNLLPAVVGGIVCGGAAQTPLPVGCTEGN